MPPGFFFTEDPNDLIGPAGFGSAGFIVPAGPLPYRVDFENEATATAPTQRVVVTDQLDPSFDWNTFELTAVGFGNVDIIIPPGSQHFQSTVDITENGQAIEVEIELGLNPLTGLVTATFQTIDPRTQLPPDVLTGFLPPEDGTGRGKGYFTYIVAPKAGLPTGTQIRNVATVVFDANAPITTDQVDDDDPTKGIDPTKQDLITIDAGPPSSQVAPLPAIENSPNFTVSWSGQDDPGGSGIASYDVYVSDNGGPFVPFLTETTQTSATFDGVNGHTYGFWTAATDNVDNSESTPTTAQVTTSRRRRGLQTTTDRSTRLGTDRDPDSGHPRGESAQRNRVVHGHSRDRSGDRDLELGRWHYFQWHRDRVERIRIRQRQPYLYRRGPVPGDAEVDRSAQRVCRRDRRSGCRGLRPDRRIGFRQRQLHLTARCSSEQPHVHG